jgi:hypothetical protein
MKKDKKNETLCRINKSSIPMITEKRRYYYMDIKEDEEGEKNVYYAILDNTKGKKEITEFDSLEELEKSLHK